MKSNLVKIISTLGLIIVIAVILKSVFGIGKIGFKNLSSKLPILKCEIFDPNAKNTIEFYDLEQIKNDDPTKDIIGSKKHKELLSQENLNMVTFVDIPKGAFKNHYQIIHWVHDNGIRKNWTTYIKKDTGELSLTIPAPTPISDKSFETVQKSTADGWEFKGECIEVKRKNL